MKHMQLTYYNDKQQFRSNLNFVVPNMPLFVRLVTEHGNIGAMIKMAIKLDVVSLFKLAWWNKNNLLKLLKKDFATGVLILIQMEILQILKYKPRMVVLTDQITDLAVALDNTNIISGYFKTIKNVPIKSGIVTNNLINTAHTLSKLSMKNVEIITPFNLHGFEMNPSQVEVENMMRLMNPNNISAILPDNNKSEDKYLKSFGIQKKVIGWF